MAASLRALGLALLLAGPSMAACTRAEPQRPAAREPVAPATARPAEGVALAPGASALAEATAEDVERARGTFARRCQMCHGPQGAGNGPMAASLSPAPRSFADRLWQSEARDADIAAIILRGGVALGRSAAMPAAPDLAEQPGTLAGLVRLVRSFGPAPGQANSPPH